MSRPRACRPVIALLCLSFPCCGYASIERRAAPTLEARIDRADSEKLYVTLEDGEQRTVNRADVVDIGHPGKVAFATGMTIAVAGASMLVYGLVRPSSCSGTRTPGEDCAWDNLGKEIALIGGGLFGLSAGGALATAGGVAYEDSVAAARPPLIIPSTHAMRDSLPRLICTFGSRQRPWSSDALPNLPLQR